MKQTIHSVHNLSWLTAMVLVFSIQGWAIGQTWDTVQAEAVQAGAAPETISDLARRCRRNNLAPDEVKPLFDSIAKAARAGLPTNLLVDKALEGLTKGVPPPAIVAAVERRARLRATARTLIDTKTRHRTLTREECPLCKAVTLALESGLPSDTLARVLERSAGASEEQLAWVIEAGETLSLSGFTADDAETLMVDCLERDLRRSEALRAVRYACSRRRQGMRFGTMRRSLWGGNAEEPPQHRRRMRGSLREDPLGAGSNQGYVTPERTSGEPGAGSTRTTQSGGPGAGTGTGAQPDTAPGSGRGGYGSPGGANGGRPGVESGNSQ